MPIDHPVNHPAFFPELEVSLGRSIRNRLSRTGLPSKKLTSTPQDPHNPCIGCPRETSIKVLPVFPPPRKVTVVGIFPGRAEEGTGVPFSGDSGLLLREKLALVGLDPNTDVGYANLARCRPEGDNTETPLWDKAERRCFSSYLTKDLAFTTEPLLLLGTRVVWRFFSKQATVTSMRGLWHTLPSGREVFVSHHPAAIIRKTGTDRSSLEQEFTSDLHNMAERILQKTKLPTVKTHVFPDPFSARPFLEHLSSHPGPWAFDIETYDNGETPSRSSVATDPCHPDFRVRGIAIATAPDEGFWIELSSAENEKDHVRSFLSRPFHSSAEKWAFFGHFDEEGLVYTGWIDEILSRSGDGLLALVALGDGRQGGNSLHRAVVDVLKQPYHWEGVDKTLLRVAPIELVAEGSIRDACCTYQLCEHLHSRLAKGEYL